MTEYNQKQSKEIYEALLESKVDLLEYFLGPDPRHTNYYKALTLDIPITTNRLSNVTECNPF